jgi:hypothetical protein
MYCVIASSDATPTARIKRNRRDTRLQLTDNPRAGKKHGVKLAYRADVLDVIRRQIASTP